MRDSTALNAMVNELVKGQTRYKATSAKTKVLLRKTKCLEEEEEPRTSLDEMDGESRPIRKRKKDNMIELSSRK